MSKSISRICSFMGLALAVLALWLAFGNLDGSPVLLKTPEEATARVKGLMDAVCAADYQGAQAFLYGSPELGMDVAEDNAASQVIRPLYKKSLSYSLRHDPYVTDSGLSVCLDVQSLDAVGLTEEIVRQLTLLAPEDPEALESWAAALAAVPQEAYPYRTQTITLNLTHSQGIWWILPEEPLLNLISGITQ